MLWTESILSMIYSGAIGGLFGGCLMALANKGTHKNNLKLLEGYWNSDLRHLKAKIHKVEHTLSTIPVSKPVFKSTEHPFYKHFVEKR